MVQTAGWKVPPVLCGGTRCPVCLGLPGFSIRSPASRILSPKESGTARRRPPMDFAKKQRRPGLDKAAPFTPEGIWPPPHLSQVVSFGCHVPGRHCWAQARLAGAFWTPTLFICSETPVPPQDVAIENLPGCARCPGLWEGRILHFPERHPRPLQTLSQGDLRGLPEEQDGAPPQARQRPPGRGAENLLFSPV